MPADGAQCPRVAPNHNVLSDLDHRPLMITHSLAFAWRREDAETDRSTGSFRDWFLDLDTRGRQLVDDAVARMRLGNLGVVGRVQAAKERGVVIWL